MICRNSIAPLSKSEQVSWDERFMHLALRLGRRGMGQTAENPSVGCVLVQFTGNGPIIVGQGHTQPGGRPHAERVALAVAGDQAKGATAYVT
ncbi:MAG TPA: riboflavin biosynthesis protein RibD, partial [Rhizobiales bacterium]|nr:riboflavin biosynthesis protein RibD [Hyphomicrobiales bacterium]